MVPVAQQISQIGLATADQLSAYRAGERDAMAAQERCHDTDSPGAMVFTRIRCWARSRAIGSVIPTIPLFDAEYAAWPI